MTEIRLLAVPYEVGALRMGVGRGPERLIEAGAQEALGSEGAKVSVETIELQEDLRDRSGASEAKAAFEALHLEVTPFEPAMAWLSARYVHKGISLGDRCFLAASHMHGSGWTSDRDLRTLLRGMVPQLNYFR